MAVFNIVRAGRKNDGYMEKLIHNMYADERVVSRQGYGILDKTEDMAIHSFNYVRNTYCKINSIKVHYMEIYVEYEFGMMAAQMMADKMGRYMYENGFQALVACLDTGNEYMVAVAVNAVSYIDGSLFHDNNAQYMKIYKNLSSIMPFGCKLTASENSFFCVHTGENQYQHGVLI